MRIGLAVLLALALASSGCAHKKRGLTLNEIDQPTCDPLFARVCMPKQASIEPTNGASSR